MTFEMDHVDLLKGRIAEGLVEALFHGSGLTISRTGFEWLRPLIPHQNKITDRQINNRLGGLPDFCVIRTSEAGKIVADYLEVRFRWDGILTADDISALKNNPWKPALILVQFVFPRHRSSKFSDDKSRIRVSVDTYQEEREGRLYNVPIHKFTKWELKPGLCEWAEKMIDPLYSAFRKTKSPCDKQEDKGGHS